MTVVPFPDRTPFNPAEIAAQLADDGLAVFPLLPNSKKPPAGPWRICRSRDEALEVFSRPEFAEANIAVATDGMCVVDVDEPKKQGALAAYQALGLPRTLCTRTPSGGRHYYFDNADVGNGVDRYAPGIDIRGKGGYVLGPGSRLPNGRYEIIDDVPIADAPPALLAICRPAGTSQRRDVDWNRSGTPAARVEEAKRWLTTEAPVSVEGAGGDNTAYRVAAKLHELGVFPQDALELLAADWNERCSPPWPIEDLERFVANAATYAQLPHGSRAPDQVFDSVVVPSVPGPAEPLPTLNLASLNGAPIPAREWLVPGFIPARNVTLLYGDGAVGKSLAALQLTASVVTGQPWLGEPVARRGAAVYLSCEDDRDEVHRRASAIAHGMNACLADFDGLHVIEAAASDPTLALFSRDDRIAPTPLWARLVRTVETLRPALVALDNLADVFGGDEIRKAHARAFVAMLRKLAIDHDCAVLVLAHPSQSGMQSGSGTSGNVAWSNSVRSRLYMESAPPLLVGQRADPDVKVIRVMKANAAKAGAEIRVRWRSMFLAREGAAAPTAEEAERDAQSAFLTAFRDHRRQGDTLSASAGANYAPNRLQHHPACKGQFGKAALAEAMGALLSRGALRVEEVGPPSKRRRELVEVSAADATQPAAELFGPTPERLAAMLHAAFFVRDNVGSATTHDAAKELCREDESLRRMGAAAVKDMVETALRSPVVLPGGMTVRFKRDTTERATRRLVVFEAA